MLNGCRLKPFISKKIVALEKKIGNKITINKKSWQKIISSIKVDLLKTDKEYREDNELISKLISSSYQYYFLNKLHHSSIPVIGPCFSKPSTFRWTSRYSRVHLQSLLEASRVNSYNLSTRIICRRCRSCTHPFAGCARSSFFFHSPLLKSNSYPFLEISLWWCFFLKVS